LVSEPPLDQIALPPEIETLRIDPSAPLVVVDVDEVLAMFMRGFERFLGGHGLEVRLERFALFQNIFRPGEAEHLDVAAGRRLKPTSRTSIRRRAPASRWMRSPAAPAWLS
jgi:hypothetical protein